jgi:hypothetical protein
VDEVGVETYAASRMARVMTMMKALRGCWGMLLWGTCAIRVEQVSGAFMEREVCVCPSVFARNIRGSNRERANLVLQD